MVSVALVIAAGLAVVVIGCAIGQIVWSVLHAFDGDCPCGKRWTW